MTGDRGLEAGAVVALAALAELRIDPDRIDDVGQTLLGMTATLAVLDELDLGDAPPEALDIGGVDR